ncbi:MAG: hypothetical protein GTN67_01440, partial [Hydrotalea flava]|nr:hypothetical protein [Hydrotalea flava]NIM36982.1 hypothetical protein [Hydrotalea flava]NIN02174.1 hypothetical protein [Hydrotalea flava]NIN13827.1 hypothetical protein [Hydrotalea flava]NIO92908.1 hypothetical protein [Hydrotalea flava]
DVSNDNDSNDTNLQESKKELQQRLEQLQKESEDLKKELNQPDSKDSNRYHYQPEAPKKTKVTATTNDSIDMQQQNVTDLIRTRFAI